MLKGLIDALRNLRILLQTSLNDQGAVTAELSRFFWHILGWPDTRIDRIQSIVRRRSYLERLASRSSDELHIHRLMNLGVAHIYVDAQDLLKLLKRLSSICQLSS